ncbi:MAG: hypothetical protein IPN76_08895 [Saprospiraceae bacterium]|nr:hypothetical protein [Saprospiraceae bacterium]
MKTFFKFIIYSVFLMILIGGTWCYYQGLKPNDIKALFAELIEDIKYSKGEELSEIPSPSTSTPKRTKDSKKGSNSAKSYSLLPLPPNPFSNIDNKARKCPSSMEGNLDSLASYLQSFAKKDIEKARAIYIWLTDNIDYDDYAFNHGLQAKTAEEVLAERKAVCDGFSNLFLALGEKMELEIKKVTGYAKGYDYDPSYVFEETDHAWNIIKINGDWKIFDATWGQGYAVNVKGKMVSKKKFDDYWFDVPPHEAIFTHLPADADCLISPCPSKKKFEKMTYIEPSLFKLGFDGKTIYKSAVANKSASFPMAYDLDTYVSVVEAPIFTALEFSQTYYFEIKVPRGYEVVLIDGIGEWIYFERENGVFKLNYEPKTKGEVQI